MILKPTIIGLEDYFKNLQLLIALMTPLKNTLKTTAMVLMALGRMTISKNLKISGPLENILKICDNSPESPLDDL